MAENDPQEAKRRRFFDVLNPLWALAFVVGVLLVTDVVFPTLLGWEPVSATWGERGERIATFAIGYAVLWLGAKALRGWHEGQSSAER